MTKIKLAIAGAFVFIVFMAFINWIDKEEITLDEQDKEMLTQLYQLKKGEFVELDNGEKHYVPKEVTEKTMRIYLQKAPETFDENSQRWLPKKLAKRAKRIIKEDDADWCAAASHFLKKKNIKKAKKTGRG